MASSRPRRSEVERKSEAKASLVSESLETRPPPAFDLRTALCTCLCAPMRIRQDSLKKILVPRRRQDAVTKSRASSVRLAGEHRQMDSLSVSLSDRKNLTQPKHTSDSLSAPTRCRIAYPTRRPEPTRHAHRRQRANMGMPHSTTTAARTRTTHESAAESKICARRRDKRRIAYPR
jgi:hypothetical protein